MDTNMTFCMDSEIKTQMSAICKELVKPTRAQMMTDADQILDQFAEDYRRMAE